MKRIRPALESEKTILGAILLDNDVIRDIADKLCPKDFDVYFHEELFDAMVRLHKKYGCVDVPMIVGNLNLNGEHECYVLELTNSCSSTQNAKAHADIVREKSVQRKLLQVSQEIKQQRTQQRNEKVSQIDHLASFLEESAAELRSTEINNKYLISLLVEITKGFADAVVEEKELKR